MYLGIWIYVCWYVSVCIQVLGAPPQGLCAGAIPLLVKKGGAALGCLVSCEQSPGAEGWA